MENELEMQNEMVKEKKTPRKKKRRGKKIGLVLLMCLMLLVGFFGGQIFMLNSTAFGGKLNNYSMLNKLKLLETCVEEFYLNDYDAETIENSVYSGFMEGLDDPYSVYYTKEEYDQLQEEDSGEYQGIGVTVYKDSKSGYVVIEQVMKDQPAYNAGVENGDIIIAVDGTDTGEISLTETVNLIKKSKNETVTLQLLRGTETIEIKVKRSNVRLDTVSYEMKEDKIGYISVSSFIETTDEDFIAAVDDLEKKGMKGLIIDLRDNGGGLLDSCVNMVSRIIPKDKMILYTEDKKGSKEEFNSNSEKELKVPMIILVNGNSASASEVMTGCLKDYGVATVLGSKTFGKGIVQNILPLSDGSAIKMTIWKYYTPNGNDIHEKGIEPDVKMEYTEEEWKEVSRGDAKDTQLEKAISMLK